MREPRNTETARALCPGNLLLAFAITSFPILVFVWPHSLNTMFFAISADDFHRTLYAWEVTQGRLAPSDLWPPLQFWVEALALKFYPHVLSVPQIVNLTASTGTLCCLVWLGRTLGLKHRGMLLSVILAATTPWFIWLSVSGLAEALFIFFITLAYGGVAHWHGSGRGWGLGIAALGLLAAGMLRFDGWGHSASFSLALAWMWWKASPRPHGWLVAALVPWLFPIAWLARQYARFDDPLWFSKVTRNAWLASYGTLNLETRLTWQVKDLWAVASLSIPIALVGLWLIRQRRGVVLLSCMWSSSFVLLMVGTLSHTITQASPTRLVVVHALLLSPLAALALQKASERKKSVAISSAAFVLALTSTRLWAVPAYPNGLPDDTAQVGNHIHQLRAQGQVQPGERVMVEILFWDYIILPVLTDNPGDVVYDRPPIGAHTFNDTANPSVLALAAHELRAELEHQRIRLVIAHSERATSNLRPLARETLKTGRFHVFVLPID